MCRSEKIIVHPPATVVYWGDGTKTVARCCKEDTFDPDIGFLVALGKKIYGSGINLHEVLKQVPGVTYISSYSLLPTEKERASEAERQKRFDGTLLRKRLNDLGWTVKDLAAKTGISQAALYHNLANKYTPSEDRIKSMADAVGSNPEDFMVEVGK